MTSPRSLRLTLGLLISLLLGASLIEPAPTSGHAWRATPPTVPGAEAATDFPDAGFGAPAPAATAAQ